MSGGYFDHGQYQITNIVEELKSVIWNNDSDAADSWGDPIGYQFSSETIHRLKKAVIALEIAFIEAQRADWLLSEDDGEDTYHERLEHDHRQLQEMLKTIQWRPEEGERTMKSLPYDVCRCTGNFLPEREEICSKRETCARYLAYAEWDMNTFSGSYSKGIWISAAPASKECTIKIEVDK